MTVSEPHLLRQKLAQLQHDVAVLRDWTALLNESLHELVNFLDLFLHAENRSATDAAPHAATALAHRLRTLRDTAGLTRAQLACITCLSDSTSRNIETNRHRPTQQTLRRLLPALIELERAQDALTDTPHPIDGAQHP